MKRYEIRVVLSLDDNAAHPRKWIPDAIYQNLDIKLGETIQAYKYTELEDE